MRRQRPLDVKLSLRKSPPSCAQSWRGVGRKSIIFGNQGRVLIHGESVITTCFMSALSHFADLSRTFREVREVPIADKQCSKDAFVLRPAQPRLLKNRSRRVLLSF